MAIGIDDGVEPKGHQESDRPPKQREQRPGRLPIGIEGGIDEEHGDPLQEKDPDQKADKTAKAIGNDVHATVSTPRLAIRSDAPRLTEW